MSEIKFMEDRHELERGSWRTWTVKASFRARVMIKDHHSSPYKRGDLVIERQSSSDCPKVNTLPNTDMSASNTSQPQGTEAMETENSSAWADAIKEESVDSTIPPEQPRGQGTQQPTYPHQGAPQQPGVVYPAITQTQPGLLMANAPSIPPPPLGNGIHTTTQQIGIGTSGFNGQPLDMQPMDPNYKGPPTPGTGVPHMGGGELPPTTEDPPLLPAVPHTNQTGQPGHPIPGISPEHLGLPRTQNPPVVAPTNMQGAYAPAAAATTHAVEEPTHPIPATGVQVAQGVSPTKPPLQVRALAPRPSPENNQEPPSKVAAMELSEVTKKLEEILRSNDKIKGMESRLAAMVKDGYTSLGKTMETSITQLATEFRNLQTHGNQEGTDRATEAGKAQPSGSKVQSPGDPNKRGKNPWDYKKVIPRDLVGLANTLHQEKTLPFPITQGRIKALQSATAASVPVGNVWRADSLRTMDADREQAEKTVFSMRSTMQSRSLFKLNEIMDLFNAEARHYTIRRRYKLAQELFRGLDNRKGPIDKHGKESRATLNYYIPTHEDVYEILLTGQTGAEYNDFVSVATLRAYFRSLDEALEALATHPDRVLNRHAPPPTSNGGRSRSQDPSRH